MCELVLEQTLVNSILKYMFVFIAEAKYFFSVGKKHIK